MVKTAAAILLFFAPSLFAFSGPEHIYVSNLALQIATRRAIGLTATDVEEISKWTNTADHTFGDVVALADQIKDVASIFDTLRHQNPGTYNDIDWDHLHRLRGERLRSLQAKTLNENHFQSLALATHLVNHRAAAGEARGRHWARALLFEGYALHHLQDFLSPGHVATARSGLADFVSIGLHDKYTDRGLYFRFDDEERLIKLAQFVVDHHAELGLSAQNGDDLKLGRQAFEQLVAAMKARSREHFLGDSHLDDKKLQAAFVTVVSAFSISELFQQEGDAFAGYCFHWGYKQIECPKPPEPRSGMLRAAQIVGGGYDDVVRSLQFFIPGEILFVTWQSAVNPDKLSTDQEGGPVGQRSLEVETLLAAVSRTSGMRFAPSFLAGYSRLVGPGPSGRSAHVRLIVPIPRTNLQFSVVRAIDLERRHRKADGVILEAGFGLIFIRFGAQQNRNYLFGGRVNRTTVYTFGVSGIVPMRTVLHAVLP